jgi:hypothetical protein
MGFILISCEEEKKEVKLLLSSKKCSQCEGEFRLLREVILCFVVRGDVIEYWKCKW